MKKKLLISFSGGRTSAYMLWWLFNCWEDRHNWEIIVVFANTGKEVEGTLFFVDECMQEWDIPIHWVEYSPGSVKGRKVNPVMVDYQSASRKGEPFERMIAVLGIPSTSVPFCSSVLKKDTIKAYLRRRGWKKYYTAIGIRADESDRISVSAERERIIYPLIHINPKTKKEILDWWKSQPFDLDIHPDDGNCDRCWKKNTNLLCRATHRDPASFTWWQDMSDKYGEFNPRSMRIKPPFNFYRGNRSPKDIFVLADKPIDEIKKLAGKEKTNSCSESCEAF